MQLRTQSQTLYAFASCVEPTNTTFQDLENKNHNIHHLRFSYTNMTTSGQLSESLKILGPFLAILAPWIHISMHWPTVTQTCHTS